MTAYEGTLGWQDAALCAQSDAELWFPTQGRSMGHEAKKICASCPVKRQCLDYALAENIVDGIYEGVSERDRRALRNRAA